MGFCTEAKDKLREALEKLWVARDTQLWFEDATGRDDNIQHKLDDILDELQNFLHK